MDGARLGYGLMCKENDLTLSDITANTDVFYIGGTKVGALFGEAVVIRNEELKKTSVTISSSVAVCWRKADCLESVSDLV